MHRAFLQGQLPGDVADAQLRLLYREAFQHPHGLGKGFDLVFFFHPLLPFLCQFFAATPLRRMNSSFTLEPPAISRACQVSVRLPSA